MNGTIIWNFTNETIFNTSAGFNPTCLCPGLNTDFGYLFILLFIFALNSLPESFISVKLNLDKEYYTKLIALIATITILSFSTINLINTVAYIAVFALLGFLIGNKYFSKKIKLKNQ